MVTTPDAANNAARHDGEPALALERVTFGYGGAPLLREVTLRVRRGELVGLLGPNGAGKSTLLKLASGVLRPASGDIRLDGDPLRRLSRGAIARRVAVVPQDFAVQFAYTARQIVELGRMPHAGLLGTSDREGRAAVAHALAETNTSELAERVFNELSGGERQRVILALALAQQAGIVLLDEPTAHLDIRHQIETLDLLHRLNRDRGLTVIAALHDLNLAARYFPRLVLFQRAIVADGAPAAVLQRELISRVYQTPVEVGILPGAEHLTVLPPGFSGTVGMPNGAAGERDHSATTVHVVAGGGAGALLMRALADARVPFSVGPLNVGDTDRMLATRLAATTLEEPPFAAISPEGLRAAAERMAAAAATVVCPVPLGPGNVALLDAALDARRMGRAVLLLEPEVPDDGGDGADRERQLLALVAAR
ncbi:MAG: ABC transporter ATP-binding protein, partial [Ktedonobacterales bacterium]